WCRRIDELVDGPNAPHITPEALDRCEASLEDIFTGRLFELLDAALSDTVSRFHVDIQVMSIIHLAVRPFRDMVEGMRMNLWKFLYNNFDELYLYCYYVASTVGLMSVPDMGIAPESKATTESVYNAALALGIATQLTNILRNIGEIYSNYKLLLYLHITPWLSSDCVWRGFHRSSSLSRFIFISFHINTKDEFPQCFISSSFTSSITSSVYATAVGFDRGCRVMNSFVHSLPMLLGPFKNVVRCVLDPPNVVGNPNFVFEGKTIQRMEP
ncbi:hypothetical protein H5410_041164, partial [Solanum commersonii]